MEKSFGSLSRFNYSIVGGIYYLQVFRRTKPRQYGYTAMQLLRALQLQLKGWRHCVSISRGSRSLIKVKCLPVKWVIHSQPFLQSTCSVNSNCNSRICSAPPTISLKVHYIVSTQCEKEKISDGAWMLLSRIAWVSVLSVGDSMHEMWRQRTHGH